MITSSQNPQIKELIQLQKKPKLRKETKTFVVEGRKMIEESQGNLQKVFVSESVYEEEKETAFLKNLKRDYPFEIVSDKVLKEVSDTMTPQGMIGVAKLPEYTLDEVIKGKEGMLVLLEDLRDPGNLGTIMRTAEGAGALGVILSKDSVDLFNPKVIRSTMGSVFRVPFLYVENFKETIDAIQKEDYLLYATHLKGARYYDEEAYGKKCGVIIGNEAKGISEEVANMANCLVKIPMGGKLESLNASVAAGIMMYEVYRQRRINTIG